MNLKHHSSHVPQHYDRSFALGVILNTLYALLEALAGWLLQSVALIADAGHNLTDVVALILAWGAYRLSTQPTSTHRTYGFQRLTILASLASGVLLLAAVVIILWEAWQRFLAPEEPISLAMGLVAFIGVGINIGTALLFHHGSEHDLNIRGAWLHMLADAGVSLAVVIAAILIYFTQWLWLDPSIAVLIALVILWATWGLLRESFDLISDAVPTHVDAVAVAEYLKSQQGVTDIHDLHIWALSTTETALTVHLVMPQLPQSDHFLFDLAKNLKDRFTIDHPTIQIEQGNCPSPSVHP